MSTSYDSPAVATSAFDSGFRGYDPPLSSQRFGSFSSFAQSESAKDPVADDDSPLFTSLPVQYASPPINVSGSGSGGGLSADPVDFSAFSFEANEKPFEDGVVASSGPVLPPPTDMPEVLRDWMRQNAIRLEQKDKNEKGLLSQIIDEANEYKDEFYKNRQISLETNKGICREKEKLFLCNHEKFHAEADKHYWKTIAELVLNEVPTIEKKKIKDQEKERSIPVIQGPKPGKPADLSRMWEILLKLKHNTPLHLSLSPPPALTTTTTKDGKSDAAKPSAAVAVSPKPVAVA